MMAKQGTSTVVPKLRFPEFRGKDGWQAENLGAICEVLNNRRCPITSKDRVPGPFPYYGASGVVDSVNDYIFDERLLLVGEDGAKWGRFEATAFIAEGKYWVNNHAHVLKSIGIKDSLLESYLTMIDIAPFVTGAAPPKLTLGKLKSIPIPVPATAAEQQKIADCLTSLDEVIAAQGRKVEALKAHKRGLMQQLFPREGETHPRLRFPEFRNAPEWEELPLGELVDLLSGYPFDGKDIVEDGAGERLMRGINITEGAVRHSAEIDRYYPGSINGLEKYRLEKNDLVIGMDGSKVGKNSALIGEEDVGALLIQRVARLRADSAPLMKFVFQQIHSPRFHAYVDRINTSSGIPHISAKQIKEYPIHSTSEDEQHRIADCLSSLDTQIAAESNQLAALKTHKQGLMQQLFPASEGVGT